MGWSGGAKVLGKLPVPGRPTNLAYSRARAYCAFSRCGWGLFGHFFSHLSLLFSFSLSMGDGPMWTEILSQRAVEPEATKKSRETNNRLNTKTIFSRHNSDNAFPIALRNNALYSDDSQYSYWCTIDNYIKK